MTSRGPRPVEITLSEEERSRLESWARRRNTAQALALRSRIVLGCAAGENNTRLARRLGVSVPTVRKWRGRFACDRLDGLLDEPRPGKPRTVSDERVEEIIVKTLKSAPPDGGTHWSSRQMAAVAGVSQSTVSRVWRAFGLQPHRVEHWKLSKDPLFVEKVKDIVGLYLDPPERAMVLAVDEKSQIQALDRSAPILPVLPGTPERATHDYKRNGTSSLFAALEVASGKVIGSLHSRHRAIEFKKFLQTIDREVPEDLEVHLILDNYQTHKTPMIKRWVAAHPRFHFHFTPTGASWLNLVERWFGELTARKIKRSSAARTGPSASSTPTFATGSTAGTGTRSRTCGPRPPSRSSKQSPHTANESPTQDTSRAQTVWQYRSVSSLSGLLPPSPAPPGSDCPQLQTARCDGPPGGSFHPTRSDSASWRTTGFQGGFKRSLQRCLVDMIVDTHPVLRLGSAIRVSCGGGC